MGIAVQSVARASKIIGAHGSILGLSTYIYTHMCQVEGCKFGKNKGTYGNDDETLVWKHVDKKHGVTSP